MTTATNIIEFPKFPQTPTMVPVTEPTTRLIVVDGKLEVENANEKRD